MENDRRLPHELSRLIEAELSPQEQVLWSAQPLPGRYMRRSVAHVIFGIPWTAFAVAWVVAAWTMTHSAPNASMPAGFSLLFPLAGLLNVFVGLCMLSSPYWMRRKAQKTVYALTDRRALILTPTWRGGVEVRSVTPEELSPRERTQNSDGSGSLFFSRLTFTEGSAAGPKRVVKMGFEHIADVRDVEALIEKTHPNPIRSHRLSASGGVPSPPPERTAPLADSGSKPYDILATAYAPRGAGEAARMAAPLGLPRGGRGAEVTPTEGRAQAVKAGPRTPAREARGRRLKVAGGVALGLLLVNSFAKGVVWEDHWTAPDGSAITRRTTGFWWQTVAISPRGERSSQTHDHYFFYTSSASEGTLPDVSGPRANYRWGLRLGGSMAADDAPVPLLSHSPGQAAADSFQAAPGATLGGQGGGTGWAGNWSGAGALVAAGSLADPSGALAVGGHSVHLSAPGGQIVNVYRRLASRLGGANTTAWISFTVKRTRFTPATAAPAFGGVCLGLTGRDPQLFIGDTGSGRWGMNTAGGEGTVNARGVEANVPVFLVVRADFRPGGDRFTLYQDPTPGRVAPNVAGVVKTGLTISGVDWAALRAGYGNAYTLDELRLGTSYHDVAPSDLKHAPGNVPAASPS